MIFMSSFIILVDCIFPLNLSLSLYIYECESSFFVFVSARLFLYLYLPLTVSKRSYVELAINEDHIDDMSCIQSGEELRRFWWACSWRLPANCFPEKSNAWLCLIGYIFVVLLSFFRRTALAIRIHKQIFWPIQEILLKKKLPFIFCGNRIV